MKKIVLIFILISSQTSISQTIDLLKDFDTDKRITFSYVRQGYPGVLTDTTSQFDAFNGSIEVTIDSIIFSPVDSVNFFYLSIRKVGIKTIIKINRIVSVQNIDIINKNIIIEYLKVNYHAGIHRLSGWLIPDTVLTTPLCPYEIDTTIYYRYPYYFRYYSFPTLDTLDFQADTLLLRDRWTDCLDAGFTQKFRITTMGGLDAVETDLFNWFDWSTEEKYVKINVTTSISEKLSVPSFSLYQNYPNPFNPTTTIEYYLQNSAFVQLKIFNILGQEINTLVNEYQTGGTYKLQWDSKDKYGKILSSGIYIYRISTQNFSKSKKMLLVR